MIEIIITITITITITIATMIGIIAIVKIKNKFTIKTRVIRDKEDNILFTEEESDQSIVKKQCSLLTTLKEEIDVDFFLL